MEKNKIFEDKIAAFAFHAEQMPGVVIIHKIENFPVVYMSSKGLEELGTTLQELQNMDIQYYPRYFNIEDVEFFKLKLTALLENNDPKEIFTYFQQVKLKDKKGWVWHLSSTRIFYRDENKRPTHIVTISVPIGQMKHIPHKAERLLAENMFYRNNLTKFDSLGKRAKEILKFVALGKSSNEIAEQLNISIETVSTHRKLIKHKLNISNNYEFMEYALAFDLI